MNINNKLEECLRFNKKDKLNCGQFYKAHNKCKSHIEKLKELSQ
jgi:hypothetical protein